MKKRLIFTIMLILIIGVITLTGCSNEGIPVVEELTIVGSPVTVYRRGETIDLNGAQLNVLMSDGNEIVVPINESMLSTYDMNQISTQTVVIRYREATVSFSINVLDAPIVSIAINVRPTKTNYIEGEELDLRGGSILVNYDIGEPSELAINSSMISNFDRNKVGEQNVIINYEGFSTTYKVNVRQKALVDLRIHTPIDNLIYTPDDTINLAGGRLRLTYDNGSVEYVNMLGLEGLVLSYNLENAVAESSVVTINYKGFSTTFNVTVYENAITSYVIKNLPVQRVNNELNLSGASIDLRYSDGDTATVALDSQDVQITGYDKNISGWQTIRLYFVNDDLFQDINIEVLEKSPQSLNVTVPSDELIYQSGLIDISNWRYTLQYDNGDQIVDEQLTLSMVDGGSYSLQNTNVPGVKSLKIIYSDIYGTIEKNVNVNIIALEIVSSEVNPKMVLVQYRDYDLNVSGFTLDLLYNSGQTESISLTHPNIEILGYNRLLLGDQTVNVSYANVYDSTNTSLSVKVIKKVESLSVVSMPNKVNYIQGETFESTGLALEINYEGDLEPSLVTQFGDEWQGLNKVLNSINFNANSGMYDPINVRITYTNSEMDENSVYVDIPVSVKNDLVSIALDNPFDTVIEGSLIAVSNYQLVLTYENGYSENIPLTHSHLNYDHTNTTIETRDVVITVSKRDKIATATYSIEVIEKSITGIEIKSGIVFTTSYDANPDNMLDTTGIIINVKYDNNTSIEINWANSNLQFSGFMPGEAGMQTIVITYLDEFITTYQVEVTEPRVLMIRWVGNVPTVEITQGQEIVFEAGLILKVELEFGLPDIELDINDILDDIYIIDADVNLPDFQQPKIVYRDKELVFNLIVGSRNLVSIEAEPNFIPDVKEGMALDLRNSRFTAYFDNGTSKEVFVREEYTNYVRGDLTTGARNITVTYTYYGTNVETRTINTTIIVLQKQLASIEIIDSPKINYIEGQDFSLLTPFGQDATIRVNFDNQTSQILFLKNASINTPTAAFNIDISAFNNSEFSGTNQAQKIFIYYTFGTITRSTEYNIYMNDRLYAQVAYNPANSYNFYYGSTIAPNYDLMGYANYDNSLPRDTVLSGSTISYYNLSDPSQQRLYELPKDVGSYRIVIEYPGDQWHNALVDTSRTLNILKKSIFVYVEDNEKIYGEENPELNVIFINPVDGSEATAFAYNEDGSVFGDSLQINYANQSGTILSGGITKTTGVGVYTIILSGLVSNNYQIEYVLDGYQRGRFEITRREVKVTAHPQERVYGISNIILTYTVSQTENPISGLANNDILVGNLLRPSNNDVGIYTIDRGTLTNNNNPNYNIEFVTNTVTITPKDIYVVGNKYQKVYGDENPLFGVTYYSEPPVEEGETRNTNAFVYSDNPNSFSGNLSISTIPQFSNVGTYTLTVGGITSNNYNIHFENGQIVVNKRPIEVQVIFHNEQDGKKTYGELDPAEFYYQINSIVGNPSSGIVNNDILTGELLRETYADTTQNDDAGTYAILQGSLANPNYNIVSFISLNFEIIKREVTLEIEAVNLSKIYDGALPIISEYNMQNTYGDISDKVSLTFSTPSRNVGNYNVLISNLDTNHNITFLNPDGYVYTIHQKEVSLEFKQSLGGEEFITLTPQLTFKGNNYVFAALVNQEDLCVNPVTGILDNVVVTLNRSTAINVDTYVLIAQSLDNPNYKLPAVLPTFNVQIIKRELIMTLNQAGDDEGEEPNEIRVPYTGSGARVNRNLCTIEDSEGNILYHNGVFSGQSFDFDIRVIDPNSSDPPRNVRFDAYDNIIGYDIDAILTGVAFSSNNTLTLKQVEINEDVFVDYTFIIETAPAIIIITSGNLFKVYDGQLPHISAITSLRPSIGYQDLSFTFTRIINDGLGIDYVGEGYDNTDVGSFNIEVSFNSQHAQFRNFDLQLQQDYVYVINKRAVGVTLKSGSRIYNGNNLEIDVNSLIFGTAYRGNPVTNVANNRLIINATWTEDTRINVGHYEFTLNIQDRNHIVTQNNIPAVYSIQPAEITFAPIDGVNAIRGTKVYGENDPTIVFEPTGLIGDEELIGNMLRAQGENVGSYNFDLSELIANNLNYYFNYNLTQYQFTITPKPINVFIKNLQGGDYIEAVYGEFDNIDNYAKFVIDHTELVNNASLGIFDTVADVGGTSQSSRIYTPGGFNFASNAGVYDITSSVTFTVGSNYVPRENPVAQIEITRAPLQLQLNFYDRLEVVYGQDDDNIIFNYNGIKWWDAQNPQFSVIRPNYSVVNGINLLGSNVGTLFDVIIVDEPGENHNYAFDFSNLNDLKVQIIKAPLTIKVVTPTGLPLTTIYGEQPDYLFEFEGFVLDEGPEHPDFVSPVFNWDMNAGEYFGIAGITPTVINNDFYYNYEIEFLLTDYKVEKRTLYVALDNNFGVFATGTPFANNWFAASIDGLAVTPQTGITYIVLNEGPYKNKAYIWNGSSYVESLGASQYSTVHLLSGFNYTQHSSINNEGVITFNGNYRFAIDPVLSPAEQAQFGNIPHGFLSRDTYSSLGINIYNMGLPLRWRDDLDGVANNALYSSRYASPRTQSLYLANYNLVPIEREVVIHTYFTDFELISDNLLLDDGDGGADIWVRAFRQDGKEMIINIADYTTANEGFRYNYSQNDYKTQNINIIYKELYIGVGGNTVLGASSIPDINKNNQVIRVYATEEYAYTYDIRQQANNLYEMTTAATNGDYRLKEDYSNVLLNYDKVSLSARFGNILSGHEFKLILNTHLGYELAAYINSMGMIIRETGKPDTYIYDSDFLLDGFIHDMAFIIDKRDGVLFISIDDIIAVNIDINRSSLTDSSIAGFDIYNMSVWLKDFEVSRQGYKSKKGVSVTNAANETAYIVPDGHTVRTIDLNKLFKTNQVKNYQTNELYPIIYSINGVDLPGVNINVNPDATAVPVNYDFGPGIYEITFTTYDNFIDLNVLATETVRIIVVSKTPYSQARLMGSVNTPNIKDTNVAYGYTPLAGSDLQIDTTEPTINTVNAQDIQMQYNNLSMIIELERATFDGTYRNTKQIISLKTNDPNDNAYNTSNHSFIGAALVVEVNKVGDQVEQLTNLYLYANGGNAFKFYTDARDDIEWLDGKVKLDAEFDYINYIITINIRTNYQTSSEELKVIKVRAFDSLYSVSEGGYAPLADTVMSKIVAPHNSNISFKLNETKLTVYKLTAGVNKFDSFRYDYVDIADNSYIMRNSTIDATGITQTIAINNGYNEVMSSHYNSFRVDISGLQLGLGGKIEFIIASNNIDFSELDTEFNRTLKLVYEDNGDNTRTLYFVFVRYGVEYKRQELYTVIAGDNNDLANGSLHSIKVRINRAIVATNPVNPYEDYIQQGVSVPPAHSVEINISSDDMTRFGYYPQMNTAGNWLTDSAYNNPIINHGNSFIDTFTSAGIRLNDASLTNLEMYIGEGNIL